MYVDEILVKFSRGAKTNLYTLMPFSDMQVGSALFNRAKWDEYVEALGKAVNPISIGCGDYTDIFRPTVQARLSVAVAGDMESRLTMDDMHKKHMFKEVLPLLKPVVDKSALLGLLAGHHDMTYADGTNSTQWLCKQLGVPYLGRGEALLRVNLQHSSRVLKFDLYATHGEGHGSAIGTPVAKLQQMLSYMDVDVALRGHSCDRFIFVEPQYYMSHTHPPRLRCRNRLIANTGGFSESRIEGVDTYVERANMRPKALGWVEIHIHVKRDAPAGKTQDSHGAAYLVVGD